MHQVDLDEKLKVLGWWLHALGALSVVLIALFAKFTVFRPIDDRASACVSRSDELQMLLKDGDRVRAEHARLTADLAVAREQATTLQARIPDEPREADFLAQVSKLAGEVGLKVKDYRPRAITSGKSYSVVQVDLICRGSHASICGFLDELPRLPRHSTVTFLQIDASQGQPEYSATLSVALYFAADTQLKTGRKG